MTVKYITVSIPDKNEFDQYMDAFNASHTAMVINHIEQLNPDYEFVQFVASPNGGNYRFCIMRLK